MKYHDGPLINMSASDVAGLAIVIFFFFLPFGFFLHEIIGGWAIVVFAAIEAIAIVSYTYCQAIQGEKEITLFPKEPVDIQEAKEKKLSHLLILMRIMGQFLAAIIVFVLITTAMYLMQQSENEFFYVWLWLILGLIAVVVFVRKIQKRRNELK